MKKKKPRVTVSPARDWATYTLYGSDGRVLLRFAITRDGKRFDL